MIYAWNALMLRKAYSANAGQILRVLLEDCGRTAIQDGEAIVRRKAALLSCD